MSRSAILLLAFAVASCSEPRVVTPTTPASPSPPVTSLDADSFISGTVTDTAARPLLGARVEVLDGPLAGTSTTADSTGHFSLTGTFDDSTRFRATTEGHVPATGTLNPWCGPCHPHRWINLVLDVLTPPVSIAGDYTVTFIAAAACETLPPEFRTHSFAASLTPVPARPDTSFSLIPIGPSFEGFQLAWAGVAGNDVSFGFSDPGVIEEVAPHTYLSFYGGGTTHVESSRPSTMSVSFDGWIDYCALTADTEFSYANCAPAVEHTRCVSKDH